MSTSLSSHRRNRSSIFSKVSFSPKSSTHDGDQDTSIPPSPSPAGPIGRIRRRNTSRSSGSLASLGYGNIESANDTPRALLTHFDSTRQSTSDSNPPSPTPGSPAVSTRPSLSLSRRSIFGSIRGLRFSEDETPPASAGSTVSRNSSFHWRDFGNSKEDHIDIGRNRTVVHHGEAVTNSGLFWKKREYLVLTETHLVRFRSQGKASEIFHTISPYPGRAGCARHAGPTSTETDDGVFDTVDGNAEKATAIPLERIVAVFSPEEGRLAYTLDVHFLDEDHAASLSLQLSDADARESWLRLIRGAADGARLLDANPISPKLAEYAARIVEKEQDYDLTKFRIYKIVKRAFPRTSSRSAPEESSNKVSATICFLVIGAHKVHIIHLPRTTSRHSSTNLGEIGEGGSFGILNLAWLLVSGGDTTFTLAFRSPFQKPVQFQLASLAASEIALQIRQQDAYLRPLWPSKPFTFILPSHVDEEEPEQDHQEQDLGCFDRTLTAFCAAYSVNSGSIRYAINESVGDSPRLELLVKKNGDSYQPLELLAILKTLRFNESFRSISFAGINFDALNDTRDPDEKEDKYSGPSFNEEMGGVVFDSEQERCVLVHEIRAIAMTNSRLRRLDFSSCISSSSTSSESEQQHFKCAFLQALAPLCMTQATNVDWIVLNGIALSSLDVRLLEEILEERSSHIRAIELSDSGLTKEHTTSLLEKFTIHDNTLEAIELAGNGLQLTPGHFTRQLAPLNLVRKLNLTNAVLVPDGTPLLPLHILSSWRLEELKLSGIKLDDFTVKDICKYLAHSQSEVLHEFDLSSCSITGFQVSDMMQSMTQCQEPNTARFMYFDVSDNNLEKGHDALVAAIAKGWAPTHFSMRSIEYESSDALRKLLLAMASNRTIRCLDMAKLVLPGEANVDTCQALAHFFEHNQTLEELDLSGEQARLHSSRFGDGLRDALLGLKNNKTLQTLRIQYQRLGGGGAVALADIIKENIALKHIYCEHNEMKLFGFTDMVNALATNKTILHLPYFEEAREAALRQTQQQIAAAQQKSFGAPSPKLAEPSIRRAWTGLSLTSTHNPAKPSAPKVGAVPQWTDHDVSAALRLVAEGWEDQMRRLQVALERNWRIECGFPVDELDVQVLNGADCNGLDQRLDTATSVSQVLEKVILQTTPTVERSVELAYQSPSSASAPLLITSMASQTARNPPVDPMIAQAIISPFLLATPPVTPRRRIAEEVRNSPTSAPSTPRSTRTLHEVELDTTPIFGDGETFGFGLVNADVDTPTAVSPALTHDDTNDEEADADEEWLMMAKGPPREKQEFGLGLHVG